MRHRSVAGLVLGVLLPVGCSAAVAPEATDAAWRGTIATEGERTVVENLGGSVWGEPRRLELDLVIGVEEGADEYMFGWIMGVAVADDRIYVVDHQAPAVRVFDLAGNYLQDLGGSGEGPGEYREPDSVAIGPDGRIFVREPRRARIHVYGPDGSPEGILPMAGGFFSSTPITVTPEGVVYAPHLFEVDPVSSEWIIGMVPHAEEGPALDHAVIPTVAGFTPQQLVSRREDGSVQRSDVVPFSPERVWAMAPSGALVVGTSDNYRFEFRHPDDSVTEIHQYWDPVSVLPDEAEWTRRRVTSWFRRRDPTWQWDGPDMPPHKAPYERFLPAQSGELWVVREGRAERVTPCTEEPLPDETIDPCWTPRWTAEVFGSDGRFLGPVALPPELGSLARATVVGDAVWAPIVDELGTITVRRYRVVADESSASAE